MLPNLGHNTPADDLDGICDPQLRDRLYPVVHLYGLPAKKGHLLPSNVNGKVLFP